MRNRHTPKDSTMTTIETLLPSFAAEVAAARAESDLAGLSTIIETLKGYAEVAASETEAEATRIFRSMHEAMRAELPVRDAEASAFEFADAMVHADTAERCTLLEQASAHAATAAWEVVAFMLDAERIGVSA